MHRVSKNISLSKSSLAEFVGEESMHGRVMSAGKVLYLIDLAAASVATKHSERACVTVAMDQINLLQEIDHGDYLKIEGFLLKVGSSSLVIRIDGYKKKPLERNLTKVFSGVVTFVALDQNRLPYKYIPELDYGEEEESVFKLVSERERELSEREFLRKKVLELAKVSQDLCSDIYSRDSLLPMSETRLIIRKVFLPKNTNFLGLVFGGDIIQLMEELALGAARQFTENYDMVTISMDDISFRKPIHIESIVEMRAEVIFVGNHTLLIEVEVAKTPFLGLGAEEITHSGKFTILNLNKNREKKKIKIGLNLEEMSKEQRSKYYLSKLSYDNLKRTSGGI